MDLSIFYELLGNELPKGELKERMFRYYNSLVGRCSYCKKPENPRTVCGSCVQRVKISLWKWYHFESSEKLQDLEFTGNFGVSKQPLYLRK